MIFALTILFLVLLFIPKPEIQRLFWLSMLWGSGSDFIFEHIYYFFHITLYQHMEPFNIGFLPLWTVCAWTPANILYFYFLPKRKEAYVFWVNLVMWSGFCYVVATILKNLDLLVFIHGGPWLWFFISIPFYYFMAKHYRYLEATSENS